MNFFLIRSIAPKYFSTDYFLTWDEMGTVQKLIYVTCYEKRDHLGFFIRTDLLACFNSSVSAEHNGASFMKNVDHKRSYDYFKALHEVHKVTFQK